MGKYKTDYERLETVKEFKMSKLSVSEFARQKGINRTTLRDWINAYDNIDGSFVRLNKVLDSSRKSVLLSNDDVNVSLLKPEEIRAKSKNFTRFDHSVVVIEVAQVKVTTSLQQALAILEKIL
ncbi:MAG TPA: helix-turn-helix domain-containing protein [Bacilli bacterium]|mgnify:CR=1 FL=1|nr:helix-turn-helix domain-containing protein [Bacilli bacterium]HPK28907.1 helix-turn-helix domain-containing protein [Bacilli bacterium]